MTPDTAGVACDGWDGSECEGTPHCPPRCPRFVDKEGARWTVRPAVAEDEPFLVEMYDGFTRAHRTQGLPPVSRRRCVDWVRKMLADGHDVVAERNGEIHGHAMYTPTAADTPELAVFVHPDAQDRGVGTELCRHVIAAAAAADRDKLKLHVETGNRAARSVYGTVGFEVVERSGDLLMRLDLDDPVATEVRWPPLVREGPTETLLERPSDASGPGRSPADD
jgi:GNAT superfamily N-acetyltransferase